MAIDLTERAAREVKTIIEQQQRQLADTYVRVGVKGGGCSGFAYELDLTDTRSEHDEQFESHGVRLLCDRKSYLFLNGTTLDFKDELMGRGFVFNNPNATSQCSCGSSFGA